ncbi:hypothetical protein G7Y79_00004g014850 [Physcia stellaris]|nr:hypothetical protein G7Y79_00004g014850 [Physcia stellaris]
MTVHDASVSDIPTRSIEKLESVKDTGSPDSNSESCKSSTEARSFLRPIKNWWCTFLRTFGFQIIGQALGTIRHPLGKGLHEKTKVAIARNRTTALLRAMIHFVPVGVAMYEIILNWNTYYVGANSYNQAVYQALAKAHEIMIQASIATIVNQISYLWSLEFWGSLSTKASRSRARFALSIVITMSIILATVCGPSSAVLLIPRSQFWPGGSTDIWINATSMELWPDRIDNVSVPASCSVIVPGLADTVCPSQDWQTIQNYISTVSQTMPEPYKDSYGISMGLETVQVTSRSAVRQLTFAVNSDHVDGHSPNPTVASVQHAAVSDAISNTGALWFLSLVNVTASSGHGAPLSDQSNAMHTIASNYSQPYSTSICLHDTVSRTDAEPLGFPILPNANPSTLANGNLTYNDCKRERTARTIHHPSLLKQDLFEMSTSKTGLQLNWIELPQDHFEGSSIGAVISLPRNESNTTQDIIVCNLSAAWGPSQLSVQTVDGGLSAVSSKRGVESKDIYQPASIKQTFTPTSQEKTIGGTWANYELSSIPMEQVVIHESWAKYLNPLVENFNTTLINVLLRQKVDDCLAVPTYTAQYALAGLIVNGMSRIGEGSRLQGDVRADGPNGDGGLDGDYWLSGKGNVFNVSPEESINWTKFHVESTLEGYAYNTLTTPPKLAIAVLAVYCALALAHVIYAAITANPGHHSVLGISSTCWDSIAEVTALAMNSTPTSALRNTCAGISELGIFKLPVRVLAARDVEGEGEHLELSFGNVEEDAMAEEAVKVNRAYGTMARLIKKENSF